MKKKIYLYLSGGLGNQLFQYAAAKNLSIINDAELIIDTHSGFVTDFKDFRKFSLEKQKLQNVSFKENIIIFWLYRIYKKIFKIKKIFHDLFFCKLINEMSINYYDENIKKFKFSKRLYLFGYFQSEKYFIENKNTILNELHPSTSNKKIFVEMKEKIVTSNSVALGLRFFETYSENEHNKFGGITSLNFYEKALRKMFQNVENPTFFIFSTRLSNVEQFLSNFNEIKKYNFYIITEDNGFADTSDNLWLMSHCVNHIISNSTLYWWAAYFSSTRYKNQTVISSENFANKDTCLDNWKLDFYN
jgi:hypothetical protein